MVIFLRILKYCRTLAVQKRKNKNRKKDKKRKKVNQGLIGIDGKPIKTVWRNKNKVLTKDREPTKTKRFFILFHLINLE